MPIGLVAVLKPSHASQLWLRDIHASASEQTLVFVCPSRTVRTILGPVRMQQIEQQRLYLIITSISISRVQRPLEPHYICAFKTSALSQTDFSDQTFDFICVGLKAFLIPILTNTVVSNIISNKQLYQ